MPWWKRYSYGVPSTTLLTCFAVVAEAIVAGAVVDVVDAAVVVGGGAVGVGAGAVEGTEGSSLGSRRGAVLASDVEQFACAVEGDGDDVGVAAEAADG